MARRMKRDASALLPPSFWPSSCSRATARSARPGRGTGCAAARPPRRRPPAARRRRAVVHRMALLGDDRAHSARACSAAGPDAGGHPAVVDSWSSTRRAWSPRARATRRPARPSGSRPSTGRRARSPRAAGPRPGSRPSRSPDRPLVEGEDGQADAVQPEALEGVPEHQLGRLGAHALAPRVALADGDVEQHGAVVGVEGGERRQADQAVGRPLVDGVGDGLGAEQAGPEEALDLVVVHRPRLVARQAGQLRVAIPAHDRLAGWLGRGGAARPAVRRSPADASGREPSGRSWEGDAIPSRPRLDRGAIDAPLERDGRARGGHRPDVGEGRHPRRVPPLAQPGRAAHRRDLSCPAGRSRSAIRAPRASAGPPSRLPSRPRRTPTTAPSGGPTTARPTSARPSTTLLEGRRRPSGEPPTLTDVADAFAAIAAARGAADKATIFRTLLWRCDPLTAKYVVKVLGGDLRIGLREGHLEAAIAAAFERPLAAVQWAGHAHRRHRPDRRAGARRRPGVGRADRSSVRSSRCSPRRSPTRPRSSSGSAARSGSRTSTTASAPSSTGRAPRSRLYSRDLHDVSGQFPEVVAAAADLPWDGILDGELLAWRDGSALPFQQLQARLGRKKPSGRAAGRGARHLRRLRRPGARCGDGDGRAAAAAAAARATRPTRRAGPRRDAGLRCLATWSRRRTSATSRATSRPPEHAATRA